VCSSDLAFISSIEGRKIHVVTVNDYLVQRDRDWTYPFFRSAGMTVGAIHSMSPPYNQPEDLKRLMYQCDVVYGTTSEFGFDYLRDNMKRSVDQQVQRIRDVVIVDEVDSILIDEARTPLIISGQAHDDEPRYDLADQLARHLVSVQEPWNKADEKVEQCKRDIKGTEGDIRNARDKSEIPAMQTKLEQCKADLPKLETERDQFVQYYEVERDKKQSHLTHRGIEEAQKKAGVGSFYVGANVDLPHLLEQSLRGHAVYEKDKDYVILPSPDPQTGQNEMGIVIVDQNTGRPMYGRQWSDGLHQAVEAKEGVRIKPETQTVATVTIQNFYKMYKKLAGMTGTADTEAQEFYDIYKLDVVVIPTNVSVVRDDHDDVVYLGERDKWESIVDEIKAFNDVGRPVLVGTTSVEKSEMLAKMLAAKHRIDHNVLNAKQHEREANIVEDAGCLGAVMIATNMAGRGTDIKLAKITREELREHWLKRGIAPRELTVEHTDEQLRELVYRKIASKDLDLSKRETEEMPFGELELKLLRTWALEHTWADEKRVGGLSAEQLRDELDGQGRFALHRLRWVGSVEELGGLHVIGTERHESRRIDNQLRGRAGRQGDNGSSRFFVSLEDDLMKMFAGETTMKILSRLGMKEGDAIEHPMLSKSIIRAQRKVEERNFQIRKNILDYDEVMEHQRQEFYSQRQRALEGRDSKGMIFEFIEEAAIDAVHRYLAKGYAAERIAEHASEVLKCSIQMERVRSDDYEDVIETIRKDAFDDSRHEIDVTIGEYIPDGAEPVDLNVKGLQAWALDRFGVEVPSADVLENNPVLIKTRLLDASKEEIGRADLSGIRDYLAEHYGERELSAWVQRMFGLDLKVETITEKETPEEVVDEVLDRVSKAYAKREEEYPIDFALQNTMAMMRQDAKAAGTALVNWANLRFGLDWEESVLRTKMPQQIQDDLQRAQREFISSGALEKAIDEALAQKTWDDIIAHFQDKYGFTLPLWMKNLHGEDRDDSVRARVESILRAELVQFERFILLEVLDPAWKEHLYNMDQLRDTIGFRAFSQQDPRIEYKREGARLFSEMMERVRDRVTDYLFKLRLQPQQAGAQQQQRPRPAPAGV